MTSPNIEHWTCRVVGISAPVADDHVDVYLDMGTALGDTITITAPLTTVQALDVRLGDTVTIARLPNHRQPIDITRVHLERRPAQATPFDPTGAA